MRKNITSKHFGDISITDEDGFYGDIKDLDTGLIIRLDIFAEIKSEKHRSMLPEFLDNYQVLDQQAKNYILEKLKNKEDTVQYYYDYHKEELPEELSELLNNEEQSDENLVKHTNLSAIWFALEGGNIIATFDYKLLNEFSDGILAIRFNQEKDIISVAHES